MKLYAPRYYKRFKCVADKCEHSCCVGWEIDIDSESLQKYKNLNCSYKDEILNSISYDVTPHFKLTKEERCPHLDARGLCKIITNIGEDCLCDICREHPRFYNYTSVAELGIGMSCREAARIILSSPDYAEFECIGEIECDAVSADFDALCERSKIYDILKDGKLSYKTKLEKIHADYAVETESDDYWLNLIESLEYLDENNKKTFMNYSSKKRTSLFDEALERFLAYFIYRHTTEAEDFFDFCRRLRFCLFVERLFASILYFEAPGTREELAALASTISEEIEYSQYNTFNLTY